MPATDNAGDDRRHILLRWAVPLGHRAAHRDPILICALFVTITVGWWLRPLPPGLFAATAVEIIICLIYLAGVACRNVHDRSLCLSCLQAAPLLDPQSAVAHNMRHLQRFHNPRHHRISTLAPVAVIAILALRALTVHPIPRVAGTVALIAVAAWVIHDARVGRIHQRLYPWCPICRRRRGPGDPAPAPAPDPAGAGQG